jgi:DNA-binding NtrC family response regulator
MSLPLPHSTKAWAPAPPAFIGRSAAAEAVRAEIAAAARTHAKVLILGETGTGKEVVARLIHAQSPRRSRPLVAINCGGIPDTLLESELFGHVRGSFTGAVRDKLGMVRQADRGTLFLDELGEMSLRMQAALLRFAETGEVQPVGAEGPSGATDVRLITATHRDLVQRIAEGAFREDLYYRLNVIQIQIPPLRERCDDVLLLLEYYLDVAAGQHHLPVPTLTPDATQVLLGYGWPGNVRELRNVSERIVLQNRTRPIGPDDLPRDITRPAPRVAALHPVVTVPQVRPPRDVEVSGIADTPSAAALWDRMAAGEDFWQVVGRAFKEREITRADLAALVDRGLRTTRGSYRALLEHFNLPPSDYKRFHAFLYQQRCNLPVGAYRRMPAHGPAQPWLAERSAPVNPFNAVKSDA